MHEPSSEGTPGVETMAQESTHPDLPFVSPPFRFLAWLHLPYVVGVEYDQTHRVEYRVGEFLPMRMRLRNDLFKIRTGNPWAGSGDATAEMIEQYHARARGEAPTLVPFFVPGGKLVSAHDLAARAHSPYFHVEETNTVVELDVQLPEQRSIPVRDLSAPFELGILPWPTFFGSQVLPILARVIDAYRVATLPAIRYSIHPVSEGLVNSADAEIRDGSDSVLLQVGFGFDVRAAAHQMQSHVRALSVASRFERAVADTDCLKPEIVFASAYYLVHMRRWTEARAIASSVVDELLRQLVFTKAGEVIGRKLWSAYRSRPRDIFLEILPAYGISKLSEQDAALWEAFTQARGERGVAVHSTGVAAFSEEDKASTQRSLEAFYGVAKWLAAQLGHGWALDIEDRDGTLLSPFA